MKPNCVRYSTGRKGGTRRPDEEKLADRQADGPRGVMEERKDEWGEQGCGNTRSNSIVIAFEGPVSAAGRDAGEGREGRASSEEGKGEGTGKRTVV